MRAVTFDDVELDFDDLLVASVADGSWQEMWASISRGLALSASGATTSAEDLTAARTAFRRARGLLAADDLNAWLSARSVTLEQWRTHVLLMTLAATPRPDDAANDGQVDGPDGGEASRAAAVAVRLEDFLGPAADPLLHGAASTCRVGHADDEEIAALVEAVRREPTLPLLDRSDAGIHTRATTVTRLRAQLDLARQQVEDHETVATVQANLVDWTEFDYDEVVLATESGAREAALCVRLDGSDLESVGEMAGASVHRHRDTAETAGPAGAFLVGAVVGEAVGPIETPDEWRVAMLRDRRPPDPDDVSVRDQAREMVLERTLGRRLAGRVTWHVVC